MSNLLVGNQSFFGLDIGITAVRLVELSGSNPRTLLKYAYVPLDAKMATSDAKADQLKLAQVISQLVKQANVSTKNVAVGIPSNQVFTTIADVDKLSNAELAKAIIYEADSLIPTPIAESKIDWSIIGDSPVDTNKKEILLSSVTNKYVETRLDLLESVGLNVIAFEPDNIAMTRAIASPEAVTQLIIDIGHRSTDIVMFASGAPRLMRSVPTGVEAFIKSASQNLNVDDKQAEQFIYKFGLSKEKLEGQILESISGSIDLLVTEIEKSLKFFAARYNGNTISKIIVTGGASVIPEFPLFLADKFSVAVEIGDSWRNISYSKDRQNELLSISNQFAVAVGLAERV